MLVPTRTCSIHAHTHTRTDIAVFSVLKERLEAEYGHKDAIPGYMLLGAGVTSSIVAQIVSYPLAVIRTRMQAQGIKDLIKASTAGKPLPPPPIKRIGQAPAAAAVPVSPPYQEGAMLVITKMYAKYGIRGFYRGLIPNIFKLAPAAGISWYSYEMMKRELGVSF